MWLATSETLGWEEDGIIAPCYLLITQGGTGAPNTEYKGRRGSAYTHLGLYLWAIPLFTAGAGACPEGRARPADFRLRNVEL